MKKFLQLLAIVVLIAASGVMYAQNTMTVADGTETNSNVPVYGLWMDAAQHTQVIYPATEIAAATTTVGMSGASITGLTYYLSSPASSAWSATMTVRLKEVSPTTLSTFMDMTDATTVYTGQLNGTGSTMTVTFSSPYTYNGGNLLVEFQSTSGGNYSSASFYGVSSSGASLRNYSSNSPEQQNFIPKVTFTFTGGTAVTCPAIQSYDVSGIDSNSATITWVDSMNTGAAYTVTCWPSVAGANDTISLSATGTSATLTSLNPNTVYYYRVQVNCTNGDNSVSLGGSFRTGCGVQILPYSTGFEDGIDGENYFCWAAPRTGTSYSGTFPSVYEYSYNAHSGSFYYEFESSVADTEVAALPVIGTIAGTKLSFWAYSGSPEDVKLEAGVIEDDTVFVKLDELSLTENYTLQNVYFPDYNGTATRMGLRFIGEGYVMIDDLSITEFEGCASVRALTIDTVTSDTIAFHWSPSGGGESGYAVRLNGGSWIDVVDTSYIFAGVSPASLHSVDVIAICSDTSTMRTLTVRTPCADYINVPYTANWSDYDLGNQLVWCWNRLESRTSYGTVYPYNSSYNNYLYFSFTDDEPNTVVLPRVGNVAANAINIEYSGNVGNSNTTKLILGYLTNPTAISTFVGLDTISATAAVSREVNTSSIPAGVDTIWLAVRCVTTGSSGYAYLREFSLGRYSTCARPDYLEVSNVTHNSATLTWNNTGANGYQIAFSTGTDPDAVDEDDLVNASDTTADITGLALSTTYNTWVRSVCSDDVSAWRQGPSFLTLCGPDGCTMVIDMTDGYGDGWNGNAININVNGQPFAVATIDNGSSNTYALSICNADTFALTWTQGNYAYEASFTITLAGNVIASGSGDNYSNGAQVASFVGCPTCNSVASVSLDSTTATSATIHWTRGDATDNTWAVNVNGTLVDNNVTDTFYTFTGLNSNTLYTLGVATACGTDNLSDFTTVQAATGCAGLACDMYVTLDGLYNTGYGNYGAWYYAELSMEVYQNGILKGTLSPDYDDPIPMNYNVTVCAGDSVQIIYHEGEYSSWYTDAIAVASYVMLNGTGDTISSASSMTGNTDGSIVATAMTACPSCITPINVNLASATITSMTIGWTDITPAIGWNIIVSDGTTVVSNTVATTNPATISGLQPNTYYYVSIAAICSVGDTSNYSLPIRMSTECSSVTLPWDYDFATDVIGNNYEMPLCWYAPLSYTTSYGDTYPYAYVYPGSTSYLYFYVSSSMGYPQNLIAATPRIPEAGNDLYVSFHADGDNTTICQAGVMTNVSDPTTFIPLVTVPDVNGDYEFFTTGVTGLTANDTVHVAFRHNIGSGSYGYYYLYSVHVQKAPACVRPDSVWVTSATTTSVTLNWTNTGATRYEVTVDGTVYSSTTNSVTITGLMPGTNYDYSLVGICSDTSIAKLGNFSTECPAAITLPFNEDFESYPGESVPNCWTVKNPSPDSYGIMTPYIYHPTYSSSSVHSGEKSLMFYGSNTKHPMIVSPALTGEPINNLWVSFWIYGGSSVGFEAGIMTDPAVDSTFMPMLTVGGTTYNMTNYTFRTDSIPDTAATTYHFAIRFNNTDTYTNSMYLDDLQVRVMPDCAEDFASIRVNNVTTDSATVSFAPGLGINANVSYSVNLMSENNTPITSISANTTTVILDGLNASTTYRVSVDLVCGGTVTATSDTVSFTTRCLGGDMIAIEDTVPSSDAYLPINHYYRHSASQQIYFASELGGAANITSIAFNYLESTPLYGEMASIYMAHTSSTAMSAGWVDESTMQLVYAGYLDCEQGWNEFLFTTPFEYNGTDNLLLMVVSDSTGYAGSGYRFATHEMVSDSATLRFSSDTYVYEYGSSNTAGSSYFGYYRNDIRFYSCSNCAAPAITGIVPDESALTVNYTTDADSVEVLVMAGQFNPEAAGVVVAATGSYTATGLTHSTLYNVAIRTLCGDDVYSEWNVDTARTLIVNCGVPTGLAVTENGYTSTTFGWTAAGDEHGWELEVYNTIDSLYFTATAANVTATGLISGQTYNARVRALCGQNADIEGDWSDPISFTTDVCEPVTGVTVTGTTGSTATLTWNATATGTGSYRVEYGFAGFNQGQGQSVTAETNSVTITGLESQTMYDAYVANICTETLASAWSTKVSFETAAGGEGIADVDAEGNLTLYPNPATTTVTLAVSELFANAELTIVDLNGRTVLTSNLRLQTSDLDISTLAPGAYFVRLTGEKATVVRKLIVK